LERPKQSERAKEGTIKKELTVSRSNPNYAKEGAVSKELHQPDKVGAMYDENATSWKTS
jgi:hypothetical protein